MRARASWGCESPKTRTVPWVGRRRPENAQERGLACAVFAEEDVAAAGLEIERNLAESGKAPEELGHLDELRVIGPGAEG